MDYEKLDKIALLKEMVKRKYKQMAWYNKFNAKYLRSLLQYDDDMVIMAKQAGIAAGVRSGNTGKTEEKEKE